MKLSISRKMGVIVAATLFVTLSAMLILLLTQEQSDKINKAKENVTELSDVISESIIFSMGEGITDVSPFIERSEKIDHISELRIIPTNKIKAGSENLLDAQEREVLANNNEKFYEEEHNGEDVCRTIKAILADENCISCHDANVNDPLAIISLRYSMKEDYEAIASQRLKAILMAIGTIIIAFIIVMLFLKREVIKDLLIAANEIKKLSTGDISCKLEIKRHDELGELCNSVKTLISSVKAHSEAADQIAHGNMNAEINRLSEKDVLGKAMITVKESITYLLKDIEDMSVSAKEGNLKKRINPEKHSGDYKKIVLEYNETVNAMSAPVEEGSLVLAKMAEGDFTIRMIGDYQGDFLRLSKSINQVALSMDEALLQVSEAVQATASASNQISSSSEEMAAGANEQSAQTAEVAASVEEMTKTIFETSKNTDSVSTAAREAEAITQKGKIKVENTKESIEKIVLSSGRVAGIVTSLVTKSEQIGNITQVINDIADQTNLLALNAAIEAARAGEQGRGFAVVADEVRKLAERTTKATKEIAETIRTVQLEAVTASEAIDESKKLVEHGMQNTLEVNHLLDDIKEKSGRLTDLITQIASASEEQTATSEQISKNIEGISTVTHQSAAGTQQVAKAAEDLNRLTDNLQNLISRFKINGFEAVYREEEHFSVKKNGKLIKRKV